MLWIRIGFSVDPDTAFISMRIIARIHRPSFRENKPKTLVYSPWQRAFCSCFRENWVYKFGHRIHSDPDPERQTLPSWKVELSHEIMGHLRKYGYKTYPRRYNYKSLFEMLECLFVNFGKSLCSWIRVAPNSHYGSGSRRANLMRIRIHKTAFREWRRVQFFAVLPGLGFLLLYYFLLPRSIRYWCDNLKINRIHWQCSAFILSNGTRSAVLSVFPL